MADMESIVAQRISESDGEEKKCDRGTFGMAEEVKVMVDHPYNGS